LRETFLRHFPRPEHAAALRLIIALILELGLESPQLLETDPPRAETPTRLELAAVIRDLRHSQGSLQQIAREPKLSALSPVDEALARYAGKQAEELALIAGALERALG
jgi:hypothetical protein